MRTPLPFLGKRSGFTLIELMVVVAIIGILAAIGLAVYSGAQARARVARMQGSVKAVQAVIEQTYNATAGTYTTTLANTQFASGNVPTEVTVSPANSTTATTYCAYSDVIPAANRAGSANCTVASGTCTRSTSGDRYCLWNMQ